MNRKIQYVDATDGLTYVSSNIPDPRVELRYNSGNVGLTLPEEAYYLTEDSNYAYGLNLQGVEQSRITGGPLVAHGILNGRETYLSAAVTGSSSGNFTPITHRTADNSLIFSTGMYCLVMDRRPTPEECVNPFATAALNAEIVKLGTYVADTDPVDLDGSTVFALSHPKWSVIQPIVAVPASYDTNTGYFGYKYRLEQPTAIASVTVADGGSQVIDVTFPASTDVGIQGYMISILKKGDALSLYGPPAMVPEYVTPSEYADGGQQPAVFALNSAKLVLALGSYTVSDLNRYFKASDHTQTAVAAGVYYAIVWALTQTSFVKHELMRRSDPAISAAVIVA